MSAILQRFQSLTAEREKPIESETEARGYPTPDGYIHEVVSRSPNRQTITKRVTVTQSGAADETASTAPKFRFAGASSNNGAVSEYSTSEVGMSSAPLSSFDRPRPLPPGTNVSTHSAAVITGYSTRSPTTVSSPTLPQKRASFSPVPKTPWQQYHGPEDHSSVNGAADQEERGPLHRPREVESLGQMCWMTTTPQRRHPSATRGAESISQKRGVSIGGAETTLFEPSRVSPLLVREAYAPVRYMSKRQLREMRENEARPRSLHVRQSSVPRLDAWMEEQQRAILEEKRERERRWTMPEPENFCQPRQLQPLQLPHGGREFWPHGGQEGGDPSGGRSGRSTPNSRSGSAYRPSSSQRMRPIRQVPAEHFSDGTAVPQDDEDDVDDERWDSVSQRSSQYSTTMMMHNQRGAMNAPQQGYPPAHNVAAARNQQQHVTTLDHLPNDVHVIDVAERIAFARRITSVPKPPPHCQDAFRLLFRGTYLIKYGRQGPPHERFLAVRLVETEITRQPEPFLVWATHSEAASFKERIHLALLVDVVPGLQSPGNKFIRHLVSNQTIAGPSLGGKKSVLPTTFVFSLVFAGGDRRRTLDCLCLDEQTYHCWLMVCQYFASINNGGGQLAGDVETMAPDTPRSMSAAAAR